MQVDPPQHLPRGWFMTTVFPFLHQADVLQDQVAIFAAFFQNGPLCAIHSPFHQGCAIRDGAMQDHFGSFQVSILMVYMVCYPQKTNGREKSISIWAADISGYIVSEDLLHFVATNVLCEYYITVKKPVEL